MIVFTVKELDYVKNEFQNLMTSQDEAITICRDGLDEEAVRKINHFIETMEKVNMDECENKMLIDTVYWELGMWCFDEVDNTYQELLYMFPQDKEYADLFKKLVLDLKE